MAKQELPKLDWAPFPIEALAAKSATVKKLYNDLSAKQAVASAARKALEDHLSAEIAKSKTPYTVEQIAAGKVIRFSWKWGKMSAAWADPSKSATGADMFDL